MSNSDLKTAIEGKLYIFPASSTRAINRLRFLL